MLTSTTSKETRELKKYFFYAYVCDNFDGSCEQVFIILWVRRNFSAATCKWGQFFLRGFWQANIQVRLTWKPGVCSSAPGAPIFLVSCSQPVAGHGAAQARGQHAEGLPGGHLHPDGLFQPYPPEKPSTMGTVCPCSVHAPDALIDFQTYPSVGSAEVTSPVPVCLLSWRYKLLHSSSSFAFFWLFQYHQIFIYF